MYEDTIKQVFRIILVELYWSNMPHIIYNVLGDHSLQCSVPDVWSDQSALSLMTNSTEMRCGHLNKTKQRLSCNVLNEEDENTMVCRGGYKDRVSVSLCPDGSLNKTCFPVAGSKSLHYTCLCHSALQHQTDNDITATWCNSWMSDPGLRNRSGLARYC